jgi:hypothetical protein
MKRLPDRCADVEQLPRHVKMSAYTASRSGGPLFAEDQVHALYET